MKAINKTKTLAKLDTIQPHIEKWLEKYSRTKTKNSYHDSLNQFFKFLIESGHQGTLTQGTIVKFQKYMEGKGHKPTSISGRTTAIRVFFNWCKTQGITNINPADGVAPPKFKRKFRKEAMEPEQIKSLLNVLHNGGQFTFKETRNGITKERIKNLPGGNKRDIAFFFLCPGDRMPPV